MKYLDELAARRRFGMKPGLETIREICRRLGNPQDALRAIHVAGTNGKGAVCAILDACLGGGRYTSPHLVNLNERFFLRGAPIDDATLERAAEQVSAVAPDDTTFFEALTAVAFLVFSEAKVDPVILETGLGGRLDATNVCRPSLCIITRIGLDHCDWLGDTVEKIAAEKAGIIKSGVPVVLGRNEPAVRAVIEAHANAVGAPFHYAPDLADESEIPADFSLVGTFNRENAVTALAALKTLERSNVQTFKRSNFQTLSRFSQVIWPGRFQRIGNFIVDGAHNPPAARGLVASLSEHLKRSNAQTPKQFALIFGACGDKDVDEVLHILAPYVSQGYAIRTNNPRSLSAEETAAKMRAAGIDAVPCASLRDAIVLSTQAPKLSNVQTFKRSNVQTFKHSNVQTLICGSLFLAGEALVELGAYPWGQTPRFDPSEALKLGMLK